jgi:hypothetical protein
MPLFLFCLMKESCELSGGMNRNTCVVIRNRKSPDASPGRVMLSHYPLPAKC